MTNDPVDKSLEQLEKEKLQAEINILNARLQKEFPEGKPPGMWDKLAAFAQKWSAFILGTVTLFSAVFGLIVPLSEYLDGQRRALEYDLNENMIGFVNDLNTDSLANRGVVMLSYYEVNSIPILLFYLETSENDQEEFRARLIETINLIYINNRNQDIYEMIANKINILFAQIKDEYASPEGINPKRRLGLLNYLELIDGMKLSSSDRVKVKEQYTRMRTEICQTEGFADDIFAIYSTICFYLEVDLDCNPNTTNN